ncbi:MAG: hypothetical protein J6Q93_01925 [Prevotella sp.]|nr:hypothetical protein [Prevotella sp.]
MKKIYKASDGMTYRRRVDGFIMGSEMILGKFIDGTDDVIDNYEEVVDENPRPRREHHRPMSHRERMLQRRKR